MSVGPSIGRLIGENRAAKPRPSFLQCAPIGEARLQDRWRLRESSSIAAGCGPLVQSPCYSIVCSRKDSSRRFPRQRDRFSFRPQHAFPSSKSSARQWPPICPPFAGRTGAYGRQSLRWSAEKASRGRWTVHFCFHFFHSAKNQSPRKRFPSRPDRFRLRFPGKKSPAPACVSRRPPESRPVSKRLSTDSLSFRPEHRGFRLLSLSGRFQARAHLRREAAFRLQSQSRDCSAIMVLSFPALRIVRETAPRSVPFRPKAQWLFSGKFSSTSATKLWIKRESSPFPAAPSQIVSGTFPAPETESPRWPHGRLPWPRLAACQRPATAQGPGTGLVSSEMAAPNLPPPACDGPQSNFFMDVHF